MIVKSASGKRFECDSCHAMTEALGERAGMPDGWMRLQRKSWHWEAVAYICLNCAKTATLSVEATGFQA